MPSPLAASWRALGLSPVARAATVAALAVLLGTLTFLHVDGINGPRYWRWAWRALPAAPLTLGCLLALVPFALGQWGFSRRRLGAGSAVVLVMVTTLLLEWVTLGAQKPLYPLSRLADVIRSPVATSYYTDALALMTGPRSVSEWLRDFPTLSGGLHLHSQTKPPGAILGFAGLLWLFGPEAAPTVAGLLIGAGATLTVPATRWLVAALSGDDDSGFHGASLLALAPGLVLFHPELDQLYPLFTCGVVGGWALALRRGSPAAAAAAGAAFGVAGFFTYNLWVLGALLLALTVIAARAGGPSVRRRLLGLLLAAPGGFLAATGALFGAAGLDPIACFRGALRNQAALLAVTERPYPATVLFDLYDVALGLGWVGAVLALLALLRPQAPRSRQWSLLCIGQLVVVAVTGLLPGETARVWLFLVPLLAYPIDRELASWTPGTRAVAHAATALALVAIARNLVFIAP